MDSQWLNGETTVEVFQEVENELELLKFTSLEIYLDYQGQFKILYYKLNSGSIQYRKNTASWLPIQLTLSNPRFNDDNSYYNRGDEIFPPERAIDGIWINHDLKTGVAVSAGSRNIQKFWVDLPDNAIVETVIIYPRRNCCFGRYTRMEIKMGEKVCDPKQPLSAEIVEQKVEDGLRWNCHNAVGDRISVENRKGVFIQIAEIIAIGHDNKNGVKMTSTEENAQQYIDNGWVRPPVHCNTDNPHAGTGVVYKLVSHSSNWHYGQNNCKTLGDGATLARIFCDSEFEFLNQMAANNPNGNNPVFIGGKIGNDINNEENWFWAESDGSDGIGIEEEGGWNNFPWYNGQPDNAGGKENCMEINRWADPGINDISCNANLGVHICEKRFGV